MPTYLVAFEPLPDENAHAAEMLRLKERHGAGLSCLFPGAVLLLAGGSAHYVKQEMQSVLGLQRNLFVCRLDKDHAFQQKPRQNCLSGTELEALLDIQTQGAF